jgi:hypothetical protein
MNRRHQFRSLSMSGISERLSSGTENMDLGPDGYPVALVLIAWP